MKKIKNSEELEKYREKATKGRAVKKIRITVCSGTGCHAYGCEKVTHAFAKEIEKRNLPKEVDIRTTGCHGFCERGPIVVVHPQGIFYERVKVEDVPEIISETIINNKIVDRLLYIDPLTGKRIVLEKDVPFYKRQKRIIFANNGLIDPQNIDDYLAVGGYGALAKVLAKFTPEKVIKTIKDSGLRGRGGAGFLTGKKWELTRNQKGRDKYIICNADEGDPGAYMDRSLLEGNPHSVIEGMIIGAFAIGAKEGWIYVRHEYPLAVKNISIAINRAQNMGFLGMNILGSGFGFNIKITTGAGAFVSGEETALMLSIEGNRASPKQRPPFPSQQGLWGKPTNINNVETWANIPLIIRKGAKWYSKIGTKTSKGTKIFSLVGKINNTGLVEVPMGMRLWEIIYEIGGGIPKDRKFKAVQTGGPSGGCIPQELLNLPIDYERLSEVGSMMGSGGMIVMDENTCMVDVARYFLNFLHDESCGKCLSCRKGIQKMLEIVTDITEGKGKLEDLDTLEELAHVVKDVSMCGLGQTASNPVLATMRYFKDEYLDHITKKKCSSGVCKELVSAPCQHICPIDTEASVYIALVARGEFERALRIIKKDNPFSSVLARVCNHPCEVRCRAGEGGESIAIRNLKRFVTDYGLSKRLELKAEPAPAKKEKVAIVGSGPAGLTCGFYLAQKGYQVTVFEKLPVIGGMLAVAIPEYRLPRNVLNADIEYIRSAGVQIKTGKALGKDFTIKKLFAEGYKAVFIATGAPQSLKLGIPGEEAQGVLPSMKLLSAINLGKKVDIGKVVGVIGGGNSAVDAARAVLRTGKAEHVTIFYRRTRAEMPAYKEEIDAALEEGIEIEFLTAPKKIHVRDGKLQACIFQKMKLGEMDSSGRRKPVPMKGSEFKANLDTLVIAISEQPDTSFIKKSSAITTTKWGTIQVDKETFVTDQPGVFAGGDVVTGPNTVVDAVASGKIVADGIDKFIRGKEVKREYSETRPSLYLEPVELTEEEAIEAQRAKMPALSSAERKKDFREVETGFDEKTAIREARRCLRCDLETKEGQKFLESLKEKVAE
jgi:NADH-quinone oxidoreductase subunit F